MEHNVPDPGEAPQTAGVPHLEPPHHRGARQEVEDQHCVGQQQELGPLSLDLNKQE